MPASTIALLRHLLVFAGLVALLLASLALSPLTSAEDPVARVVELTNRERAKAGLAPLAVNQNLTWAAQAYALVLTPGTCLAHTCGSVPDLSARLEMAGYSVAHGAGENLAWGQRTPEEAVTAWIESPGHRTNLLNPAYTEIGVGLAFGDRHGFYWVQEFGGRPITDRPSTPQPRRSPVSSTALPAPASRAPSPRPSQRVSRDDGLLGLLPPGAQRGHAGPVGQNPPESANRATTTASAEMKAAEPSRADVIRWVHVYAAEYGASADEMLRVGECESSLLPYPPDGRSGEIGPFQFMPQSGIWQSTPQSRAGQSIRDPEVTVAAAAWAFSQGLQRHWPCWRMLSD